MDGTVTPASVEIEYLSYFGPRKRRLVNSFTTGSYMKQDSHLRDINNMEYKISMKVRRKTTN